MSQTKVQLIAPIGVVTASTLETTGVLTATTFVGDIAGTVTGITSTTDNLNLGIVTATSFAGDFTGIGSGLTGTPNVVAGVVTATKFVGNSPGLVSGIADGTNINAGIITATSFVGNLTGNAAGLSTTTANLNLGIVTATSFAGNFTGVASGITGTPNIVVGIMTGTLNGDGSSLTGIAATNWIANNVTANSSTTTVDLALGNVVKFTQSANTTVSFANTGTSNIVTFIRTKDSGSTARTITWPSTIKWDGGSAPDLIQSQEGDDVQVINLLTRDEGVTWYGWQSMKDDIIPLSPARTLWVWGGNETGGLGLNEPASSVDARSSPVQIPGTNWYSAMSSDPANSASGQRTDLSGWGWGRNYAGMMADNSPTNSNRSSPIQIPGMWTQLKIGGYNGIGVKTDGTLWMWGGNGRGGLGQNEQGPSARVSSPVQVGSGTNWSYVTSGYENVAAAINTSGELFSWGYNNFGNVGDNTIVMRSSPVQIPGTTWSQVCRTNYSTGAVKTDGTLWMWGNNQDGGLGQNNTTRYSSPVQVPGTNWSKVSLANWEQGVAGLKTNGQLWVWGRNENGQLAQQNKTNYSSPRQIPGTTWNDVLVGAGVMIATKTDGTLWAWGSNTMGQLGQNDRTGESSPKQIPGTSWALGPNMDQINGYNGGPILALQDI